MATRADRIESAARALLADLRDGRGDDVVMCERSGCPNLAMVKTWPDHFCDECEAASPACLASPDMTYASAVRALVDALAEES